MQDATLMSGNVGMAAASPYRADVMATSSVWMALMKRTVLLVSDEY